MKTRRLGWGAVVALVLLLGVGSAQAGFLVTFDSVDTTQATGILDLDIDGTLYNVTFTANSQTAFNVYGPFPGGFDFNTNAAAAAAADAVNAALDSTVAVQVGAEGSAGLNGYRIGYESESPGGLETVWFWDSGYVNSWNRALQPDSDLYNVGARVWAQFTVVPAPATMFLFGPAIFALGGRRRRRTA